MATATYRMHQKLSDGSYQAIHAETEAGVVLRPNGETVEQTLNKCILYEDAGDQVPPFEFGGGGFVEITEPTLDREEDTLYGLILAEYGGEG